MRKSLIAAAAIGIVLAHPAWAQDRDDEGLQVGDFAADIEAKEWLKVESEEDIPSITELRGMVIVLFFWTSWHQGGEYLLPVVNMLEYNPRLGRQGGVFTIGVTDADRKATQPLIDEAKVFFPVGVESEAAEEYGFRQSFGFVVIDPEGRIAFKGSGTGDLNGMVSAVTQAIEETPPTKTHPSEAKICYRLIDEAHDHIRDGRFRKAFKAAQEAVGRSVLGDRLRSQAFELIDLLDLLGYEKLSGFEPLLERDKYTEAADLLRSIIRRFRGLDCYKDAKRLYEELQDEDEKFKEAAGKFDNEDVAARLYLDAIKDLRARRFTDSYDKLKRIATEYSATEAAEYAEAVLARMKRNRDFWGYILDYQAAGECKSLLARARTMIGQRRYDEAEKLLQRIMEEYPDTIWAQQAKEEMIDLP